MSTFTSLSGFAVARPLGGGRVPTFESPRMVQFGDGSRQRLFQCRTDALDFCRRSGVRLMASWAEARDAHAAAVLSAA